MLVAKNRKLLIQLSIGVAFIIITSLFFFANRSGDEFQVINQDKSYHTKEPSSETEDSYKDMDSELPSTSDPEADSSLNTIVVDVAGEVSEPAVYVLPIGTRIYQAIEAAGGLTKDADTSSTNLAAVLSDATKLYIPSKKEIRMIETKTGEKASDPYIGGSTATTSKNDTATTLVNLNTATSAQLQELPGVGPSTADKILSYRKEYGSFKTKEELMNVSGIGEKTFDKLKDSITVE